MDKYIEAEKRLAELLAIDLASQRSDGAMLRLWESVNGGTSIRVVPAWCRDDAAAFRLMVEHGVWPHDCEDNKALIEVQSNNVYWEIMSTESVDAHHNKVAAVRYAIVQAVIAKLEAGDSHAQI